MLIIDSPLSGTLIDLAAVESSTTGTWKTEPAAK